MISTNNLTWGMTTLSKVLRWLKFILQKYPLHMLHTVINWLFSLREHGSIKWDFLMPQSSRLLQLFLLLYSSMLCSMKWRELWKVFRIATVVSSLSVLPFLSMQSKVSFCYFLKRDQSSSEKWTTKCILSAPISLEN